MVWIPPGKIVSSEFVGCGGLDSAVSDSILPDSGVNLSSIFAGEYVKFAFLRKSDILFAKDSL
jgi:hypothetical protein